MKNTEDLPLAPNNKESNWFSTEKIVDGAESPLKNLHRMEEALNTAPNRFAGLHETKPKEKDFRRNNFMGGGTVDLKS
jgi:hypothetical protein